MAKQKFNFQSVQKQQVKKEPVINVLEEDAPIVSSGKTLGERLSEKKEKSPLSQFEIKFIPRHMLKANKRNNYPKEKVEEMSESILHFGLQEPLGVIYIKEDNEYIIEFGHTRTYSIDGLIEKFKNYEDMDSPEYQLYLKNVDIFDKKGYPCMVNATLEEGMSYYYDEEEEDLSNIPDEVIDSEIRLIITNEIKRNDSPALKALNIARLSKLYERKNIGKKRSEKINVNEALASSFGMTPRQVANYKSVQKLIPGLQRAFDENRISLKEGSSYAQLSEDEQEVILSLIEAGKKVGKDEVAILKKEKEDLKGALEDKESDLLKLQNEVSELRMKTDTLESELEKIPEKSVDEEQLKEKEAEVNALKAEIKAMKQKEGKKKGMSSAQSIALKNELAAKSAFEDCKKAIGKFIESTKLLRESYEAVPSEELEELSVLSMVELEEMKKILLEYFS